MDQPPDFPVAIDPATHFYSAALPRIRRFMLAVAIVAVPLCAAFFGARPALGLATGCVISGLNFYWLKRVVYGFAARVAATETPQSSSGLVFRFFVRYLLMALGAYAIFRLSPASVYGLLAGLFLPVAGIACEAVYELYMSVIRGL
jgi:hypothetical protein